jgi:ABC-type Fe3+-hydroxamate transport system substrate-binding protein
MLVKPAAYPDSRLSRIQWRDRAGFSPASRASLRGGHCRYALALLLALAACSQTPWHRVPPERRRIVALMPSFVEDLVAIGAKRQIVGIAAGTGLAVVRDVPRVADFASVDLERVVAVHPDVVVAIPAQLRLLEPLRKAGIRIVLLPDDSYASIFADLARLGALSGHEAAAAREIARLRARTARLRATEAHFAAPPSVFVVLGAQPIWTVGRDSYIGTLIALAGGRDAASRLGAAYGEYSAEALLEAQPDAIVTDPTTQLPSVLQREPWRSLRAVRDGRVFVIPDASLLERPGPRYVDGLAWLIARLHELR